MQMLRPPDAFPRTDKGWFFFIFLSSSPRNLQALPHGAQESWVRVSGRTLCPSLSHDTAGQWSVPSAPGWHPHRRGPCSRVRTQESGTLPPTLRPGQQDAQTWGWGGHQDRVGWGEEWHLSTTWLSLCKNAKSSGSHYALCLIWYSICVEAYVISGKRVGLVERNRGKDRFRAVVVPYK